MHRPLILASVFLSGTVFIEAVGAQPKEFNYDESKVPKYTLPDPLKLSSGATVSSAKTWRTKRRAEVLELFSTHVYGRMPDPPKNLSWKVFDADKSALGGKATRKQVTVYFTKDASGPQMDVLIYLPNKVKGSVPAFLGLNFEGNHTTNSDPAIRLATIRPRDGEPLPGDEKTRGHRAHRWDIDQILDKGYGLATIFYSDIDPDYFDDFKNGVHALYPKLQNRGDNFTSIGAWSWGLSRALDYFEHDADIDAKRVAVIGHSRLGKTALWAGATDERFAMVVSNDSGCGGAALSRRRFGETVKRINTSFPHWFCTKFKDYNDNEDALPVDQHMLVALAAPRPLYVASAEDDRWADPRGEFLSARHASPVYRLFDKPGFSDDQNFPAVNKPIHTRLGYHMRSGGHEVTAYDWEQYLKFADRHLK